MMLRTTFWITIALLAAPTSPVNATITVHTSDFIPDGIRSNYVGFENIPNDGIFYTGAMPYTEDGISVEQVLGNVGFINTTYFHPEGDHGWYPDGGDFGYTRIVLSSGANFDSVGFFVGTGFLSSTLGYELRVQGVTVLTGSLGIPILSGEAQYLGFSGGGFDEILIRDSLDGTESPVTGATYNALALDAIETLAAPPAPEPSTFFLASIGGLALLLRKRRGGAGLAAAPGKTAVGR